MPTTNGSMSQSGEWPAVPPAPAPTKPVMVSAPPAPVLGGGATRSADDEPPTMAIDTSSVPVVPTRTARTARTRLRGTAPVAALQESARRRIARTTEHRHETVWQPRFAYGAAVVIVLALGAVTLPLWIVLFRIAGAPGTKTADVIALCMMLTGGFLTAAAVWGILVETRGRFRMVDQLARSGDRETLFGPPDVEPDPIPFPALDRAPATDPHGFTMPMPAHGVPMPAHGVPVAAHALPITAQVTVPAQYQPPQLGGPMPAHVPAHIAARAEAEQANAAAMLEASSRLLGSFSSVLKSFGQLPAQLATLTVALALFVGATILSLH